MKNTDLLQEKKHKTFQEEKDLNFTSKYTGTVVKIF